MSEPTYPAAIAIDGPAASGKTTIGRILAEKLGYLMLDTGGMYRAVTLAVSRTSVNYGDEEAVTHLAKTLNIAALPAAGEEDGRLCTVLLNGEDVTWKLRTALIDANVSQISAYKGVREEMVRRQREIGEDGGVVMVGRDIGTVVLPQAALKLYIIASAEERARRRYVERQDRDKAVSYIQILQSIVSRDQYDSSREHSPLQAASDAIVIDTTDQTPEEIVAGILALPTFTP